MLWETLARSLDGHVPEGVSFCPDLLFLLENVAMGLADRFRKMLHSSGKVNVQTRFEILREAVSGTMSKFYQVRDNETDEIVGLKICDVKKRTFFENRFVGLKKPSEGEIGSQLDHPNIVATHEYGVTTNDEYYVVMEFLPGVGMNSIIKNKVEKIRGRRLNLIRQMAEAIQAVHDAGFIHRDICPRNFIVTRNAEALKLIDFGLTVPATKSFMLPGNRTGTPNYMAPEIVRRRSTDQRLDVFAFGVSAYQFLTFQLPWPGSEVTGKAALNHDTKDPVDIFSLNPRLAPVLGKAVMECLRSDPEDRPDSLSRFLQSIAPVREEEV